MRTVRQTDRHESNRPFSRLKQRRLQMYALVHTKRCAWQKYRSYLDKNVGTKSINYSLWWEYLSLCDSVNFLNPIGRKVLERLF